MNKIVTATAIFFTMTIGVFAAAQTFEEMVQQSTPLKPAPEQQLAGGAKITAEACSLEGKEFLGKSTSSLFKSIQIDGSRLIVADSDGVLHGLKIMKGDSCKLAVDPDFGDAGVMKLDKKIESLSRDRTGRVFASNGIFGAFMIEKGKDAHPCSTKGYVEIHADGKWGIAPWVNSTVRMVTVDGYVCKSDDWILKNLNDDAKREGPFKNVNSSTVADDMVWIGGVLAEKVNNRDPRVIIAYNADGKELFRMGNLEKSTADDGFGWIHALAPCKFGVCALDSNFKKLSFWSKEGKFLGVVKLDKLLGLKSPWLADFTYSEDGHVYIVAAQNREGSKVAEGIIFRVSGM